MSLCTICAFERTVSFKPLSLDKIAYSLCSGISISFIQKCRGVGVIAPCSNLAISSKADIKCTVESKLWPSLLKLFWLVVSSCFSSMAARYKRAALRGCKISWLASAKNRVLLSLACSASRLAKVSACSVFTRLSICACKSLLMVCTSWVRASMRFSRSMLISSSAFCVLIWFVMSEKLVTKPPSGRGLPIISYTWPFLRWRIKWCELPFFKCWTRFSTWRSISPGPHSPRTALYLIISSMGCPTSKKPSG